MYKQNLALNSLQGLICHKTQPTLYIYNQITVYSGHGMTNLPIDLKKNWWGCTRGVMVKAIDCRIVVSKFVLQSCYYVHFQTDTLGKGMNALIFPAMGKIVPLLLF